MTDTEDDKYQKVLELVESLNFNEGAYLKICNSLKSIKDSITGVREPTIYNKENLYNTEITFSLTNVMHIYKFSEYHVLRDAPPKYKYTLVKCNTVPATTIECYDIGLDVVHILFKRLRIAKDIQIQYFDNLERPDYRLDFKNLSALKRYYDKISKEDCMYCCEDSEETENLCDTEHSDYRAGYYFNKIVGNDD